MIFFGHHSIFLLFATTLLIKGGLGKEKTDEGFGVIRCLYILQQNLFLVESTIGSSNVQVHVVQWPSTSFLLCLFSLFLAYFHAKKSKEDASKWTHFSWSDILEGVLDILLIERMSFMPAFKLRVVRLLQFLEIMNKFCYKVAKNRQHLKINRGNWQKNCLAFLIHCISLLKKISVKIGKNLKNK